MVQSISYQCIKAHLREFQRKNPNNQLTQLYYTTEISEKVNRAVCHSFGKLEVGVYLKFHADKFILLWVEGP